MRILLGGCIRTSDEVSESLSREFYVSHGLSLIVFASLEFAEKVCPISRGLQTLADCSNGKSGEILRCNASFAVPRVEFLQKVSSPRGEDAHRSGIIPTFAQNLNSGEVFNIDLCFLVSIGGHRIGVGLGYRGDVLCSLEHTEGGTEGEVTNDIEREVVVPWR